MPIRILSVDGGGMLGLYTACYLQTLEQRFARDRGVAALDIGTAFDLIVGTSTGAIIGAGIALGVPVSEIANLYEQHGRRIFPRKVPSSLGVFLQLITRTWIVRKGEAGLRLALEEAFGATTLGDIWSSRKIALAIPAVNMRDSRAWVFKTPHLPGSNGRDSSITLVNACLASSAAPIFRSLATIKFPDSGATECFCDGGLWANNPTLAALTEGLRMSEALPEGKQQEGIEIFSIGNCSLPEGQVIPPNQRHRGFWTWRFGSDAAKISIGAQESAYDHMAQTLGRHLKVPVAIHRFPRGNLPSSAAQYLGLDETRPRALEAFRSQAQSDADLFNSRLQMNDPLARAIGALFEAMKPKESEVLKSV